MMSEIQIEQQIIRLNQLGDFLKEMRLSNGLTQEEASYEIGIHRNTLTRIENLKNYNIITLFKIADYFNIPINDLFMDIE